MKYSRLWISGKKEHPIVLYASWQNKEKNSRNRSMKIILISPKGPLYRAKGGIFKKALRYQPLTSLIPDALEASVERGYSGRAGAAGGRPDRSPGQRRTGRSVSCSGTKIK